MDIFETFAEQPAEPGPTPEAYARELLDRGTSFEAEWEAEALRRAKQIDGGRTPLVRWEAIETRLHPKIAG